MLTLGNLISLSSYSRWSVSRCIRSLAGNTEMSGRNSLHKTRTASSEISRPAYVNHRDTQKSLLPLFAVPVVLGMLLDGRVKHRDSFTSVTYVLTEALLNSLLKPSLYSHWSMINKNKLTLLSLHLLSLTQLQILLVTPSLPLWASAWHRHVNCDITELVIHGGASQSCRWVPRITVQKRAVCSRSNSASLII